ncbi:hypothetical protein GCM10025868_26090 [Angustibacter aerolatus]|uniref:Helicase C-terminal domain-containing protein n=1 Tax=Angustibacter aerolatus TaxID=1162965 RepID=A0ABQ6JHQ2_9ACTN|nr:DEAD/DEAH box helicase [Angustibacter aerolatus]GMA87359.1 hypothetical protein GCM10025868_26090 [Angustibacter aerolatus]
MLLSATLPKRIAAVAKKHLREPVRIELERPKPEAGEAPLLRQTAYVVPRAHKAVALGRVLDVEQPTAAIVFCRTRAEVDTLSETLTGRGYRAEPLHGGMDQAMRDRVMQRLRAGTADLLVATDVAARGLDVEQATHVVNYDVPSAAETYVHRIGRVGRGGREGVAITLAEPREHRLLKNIEKVTGTKIDVQRLPTVADMRARQARGHPRRPARERDVGRPRPLPRGGRHPHRGLRHRAGRAGRHPDGARGDGRQPRRGRRHPRRRARARPRPGAGLAR